MTEGAPVAATSGAPAKRSLRGMLGIKDPKAALSNIFAKAKEGVLAEVGKSEFAEEAKMAEIKRMAPMIVAGIVAVLALGWFIGRRG